MDRTENLEKLALLCGKNECGEALEFVYDYAERLIKNYCGIEEIPEELEETLLDMACEIAKKCAYGEDGQGGSVKSIKEGDVSVSFGGDDGFLGLKDFEKQLMAFRRLKW
ncbi:MAG: hypothetical protein IKU80_01740 [Firmicutes bacterium]|nr:hypothetical protein [Bacillota bacterium]